MRNFYMLYCIFINHLLRLRMGGKIVLLFFGDPGSWQSSDTILSLQTEFKYHFYFGTGIFFFFFEKDMWEKPVLIRPVLDNFPYICMTFLSLPYCLH